MDNEMKNTTENIEYPKNYNDIVDFKLKRLEKEYQETINKNFKQEDLDKYGNIDSDSEEDKQENNEENHQYYQSLDGEEFVEVFENYYVDNKNDNEQTDNLKNDINQIINSFPPENFTTVIDDKNFQEFVSVTDKILDENKLIIYENEKDQTYKYTHKEKFIENQNLMRDLEFIENKKLQDNAINTTLIDSNSNTEKGEKKKIKELDENAINSKEIKIELMQDPEKIKNAMKSVKIKPPLWAKK